MALELPRAATGKLLRRELRKQLPPDLGDPG
jgi:acyl-coenzyme A synthetase/AMP-(fatty) acid ligase